MSRFSFLKISSRLAATPALSSISTQRQWRILAATYIGERPPSVAEAASAPSSIRHASSAVLSYAHANSTSDNRSVSPAISKALALIFPPAQATSRRAWTFPEATQKNAGVRPPLSSADALAPEANSCLIELRACWRFVDGACSGTRILVRRLAHHEIFAGSVPSPQASINAVRPKSFFRLGSAPLSRSSRSTSGCPTDRSNGVRPRMPASLGLAPAAISALATRSMPLPAANIKAVWPAPSTSKGVPHGS